MTITIKPVKGVVVVKLPLSEFGDIPVPEKAHDSVTYGEVVSINPKDTDAKEFMGTTVHFRKYKDDARIGELCLIEIKDILGSSVETTADNNG